MKNKIRKHGGLQKWSVNHSNFKGDNTMSNNTKQVGDLQKMSVNHSEPRTEFDMLCERIQKSPLGTNVLLQIVGKEYDTDDCFFRDNEGTNIIGDYEDGFQMFLTIHNNVLKTFNQETIIQIACLTCDEYFQSFPTNEYNYLFKMEDDFSMGLLIKKVV